MVYGFKLHLVINEKGEILSFDLIAENVDDRKALKKMIKSLRGNIIKIFGDRVMFHKSYQRNFYQKVLSLLLN